MRTLAFGDLGAGVWGAAWLPDDRDEGFVCLGAPDAVALPDGRLAGSRAGGEWKLLGEGTELTLAPIEDPVDLASPDGASAGFEQLCRVTGRFGAQATEVDCLGRRGQRDGRVELEQLEAVRDVSAWFEPSDGLAVVSLRPRSARGNDADVLTAAVLDSGAPTPVADPRFSTTYSSAGRPIRSSLELWLGQEEEEYPRRAAGEALGPYASARDDGVEIHASLFKWHSRAREGAGVYILARRA
jgi:hypothetical protein